MMTMFTSDGYDGKSGFLIFMHTRRQAFGLGQ